MKRAGSVDSGTADIQFVGGGAIPTSALHIRTIPWHVASAFVRQHHYTHSTPTPGRVSFGVFDSDSAIARLIGVVLVARPAATFADQMSMLEIRRMVILDCTERNAESRVLGYVRRWIVRNCPDVHTLIAYSDPEAGHVGTIYKAAGFTCEGTIRGHAKGWQYRPGRKATTSSDKIRYSLRLTEPVTSPAPLSAPTESRPVGSRSGEHDGEGGE